MASTITVACPSCEADIALKPGLVGKKTDCPKCKYRFTVPDPDEASDAPAAEAEAADFPVKKKKKGPPMVLVGVGLGVLAVAVLAVGAYVLLGGDDPKPTPPVNRPVAQNPPVVPPPVNADPADAGKPGTTDPVNADQTPGGSAGIFGPGSKTVDPAPAKAAAEVLKPVPADKMKDPTNLLPRLTTAVLRMNMDKVLQTPLYNAFFDRQTLDFFRTSLTIEATDLQSMTLAIVDPDRDPFAVLRTKGPFSAQQIRDRLDLKVGERGRLGDRDYYVINSNPFVNAISRALSSESLLGEAGLPVTEEDKKRWKEKPLGLCVYDSQTLIIGNVMTLEQFLDELDKNGDPPFLSAAMNAPPAAPPAPADGQSGPGGLPAPGLSGPGSPPAPGLSGPGGKTGPRSASGGSAPDAPGGPPAPPMPPPPPGGVPPGPGAPAEGPTKLFSAKAQFRSIRPDLKQMLDRLSGDATATPAVIYAEVLDQRFYGRDLSLYQQVGLVMQSLIRNVQIVGIAVTDFNRDKFATQMAFQYLTAEDAKKSVDESLLPLLNLLKAPLGFFIGSNVVVSGSSSTPGASGPAVGGGGPAGSDATTLGGPAGTMGRGGEVPVPGAPGGGGGVTGNDGLGDAGQKSTIDVKQSDTIVTVDATLLWRAEQYNKIILSALNGAAAQLKGRMQVLSGDTTWHVVAAAAQKGLTGGGTPKGTLPRTATTARFGLEFAPDHRASFLVELLPYLGRGGLRSTIQEKTLAWYDAKNLPAAQTWVPEFLVPYYPQSSWRATHPLAKDVSLGGTNYVAVSGLGLDSARYNPNDKDMAKKVGMTGYTWGSKPAEVTDGLTNTMYMIQVPPGYNRPWIAGGGATVMGIDDGASNPAADFVHATKEEARVGKRGTYALMGDGSVRWVPEGIDPKVFKAMATRGGGEAIADLDTHAPKVVPPKARDIELRQGDQSKKPAVVAAAAKWPQEHEDELRTIQGRWVPTFLVDGTSKQKLTGDQLKVLKMTVDIDGRTVTQSLDGKPVGVDEITAIDPKAAPKTMTTKGLQGPSTGKVEKAAYDLVGGKILKIRVQKSGAEAPKAVKVPEEGSTDQYFELVRAGE